MESMTREIKFRFWDKDKLQMIKSFEGITQNSLGISHSENIRPLIAINGDYCLPHWGSNSICMQFTGLKDSNSKEYFDGDLVDTVYGIMEVCWNDDKLCWQMENKSKCFDGHEIDWSTQIIIGNIYQNPELLTTQP